MVIKEIRLFEQSAVPSTGKFYRSKMKFHMIVSISYTPNLWLWKRRISIVSALDKNTKWPHKLHELNTCGKINFDLKSMQCFRRREARNQSTLQSPAENCGYTHLLLHQSIESHHSLIKISHRCVVYKTYYHYRSFVTVDRKFSGQRQGFAARSKERASAFDTNTVYFTETAGAF